MTQSGGSTSMHIHKSKQNNHENKKEVAVIIWSHSYKWMVYLTMVEL